MTKSLSSFTLDRLENGELRMDSGRGKCPFEPSQQYTAIVADGVLYAATVNNFLGTESLISRATGKEGERIRTETSMLWLNEPEFVSSAFVPESQDSSDGDDDKIYFFFTETAKEFEFYTKVKVPRVARICKDSLYVGSSSTVVKLPLANCSQYSSCQDCVLARDPLCGWDTSQSACVQPGKSQGCDPERTVVKAILESRIVLPCVPHSSWSHCVWKFPKDLPAVNQRADGLEITVSQSSLGVYSCSCVENEISCDRASYTLEVGDPTMGGLCSSSRNYTVGISFFCLLLGVLLGAVSFWVFKRFRGSKQMQIEQRYAETPNSPSSPSIMSEGMPLTEKKNGLNGHNAYANVNEVCDDARPIMKLAGAPLARCDESSI
ncbi:UNVERIFIED_CONTAM: hypothetical protein FKN15_077318 [Acipenser sinensis]